VSSDSDSAGISVVATETDDESGVFEAAIVMTQNSESSGNRLRALPGDTLSAVYHDRTLPEPYSIEDELDVTTKSLIESDTPSTQRIAIDQIYLADSQGNQIQHPSQGQQVQIITQIQNLQQYQQDFTNIIQVTDSSGATVSLSWVTGSLTGEQKFEISQSWTPKHRDDYTIEIFVWKSLENASPLAQAQIQKVTIQ
jgi:hypothetical protein